MARKRIPDVARLHEIRQQAAEMLAALNSFDDVVEAYLSSNPERIDRFGMMAADRPDFVHRMRKGQDFRRSTLQRVAAYIGRDDENA
ncbi:hypothetical protein [Bosea sp. TND4EK4]|uniref:hypothetical protein n=1 Tax=Bosea sp. TND4EK4 TaxID=1907408 RepID=UPI000956E219|nr:hypothetical protein [Bosea sp. TND4EK4]SIQ76195.1 hypothetical protein SAMN05880592_105166 [Bosea sp. TND4EK4]